MSRSWRAPLILVLLACWNSWSYARPVIDESYRQQTDRPALQRAGTPGGAARDEILAGGSSCAVRKGDGTCPDPRVAVLGAAKPGRSSAQQQDSKPRSSKRNPPLKPTEDFTLLWSDEFSGSSLDSGKWTPDLGDGSKYGIPGWGNQELEYHTAEAKNLRLERGQLVIEARKEAAPGGYDYTSARIRTYGKFAVAPINYGTIKIEASILLPQGDGLWPAMWLLPTTACPATCSGCGPYGGWPLSGEIDIIENRGDMLWTQGSLHFGGEEPNNRLITGGSCLPGTNCETTLAGSFHKYNLEWERKQMRWYLDNQLILTAYSANGTRSNGWYTDVQGAPPDAPFGDGSTKFHLLLGMAVGGTYSQMLYNPPSQQVSESAIAKTFATGTKQMRVDYVRVWGR